jgi:hypothetical protein
MIIKSFTPNLSFPDANNDQVWTQIRRWRNSVLLQTDWTQLQDAPVNREAWATYRQKLRDLDDTKPASEYVSPIPPTD